MGKGSEFHNRSMKSWLQESEIEMNSIHNEEKSIIVERYIRILENKIYKFLTQYQKMCIVN